MVHRLADLLVTCKKCSGSGVMREGDDNKVCDVCGGNGRITFSWVYAYNEVRGDNGRTVPAVSESD